MTTAKHSPGPWVVCAYEYAAHEGVPDFVRDDDCMVVAGIEFQYSEGIAWASARLIAAAPELLAALESVYRCLSWHEANHGVAMDRVAVERARLAIAAARGE